MSPTPSESDETTSMDTSCSPHLLARLAATPTSMPDPNAIAQSTDTPQSFSSFNSLQLYTPRSKRASAYIHVDSSPLDSVVSTLHSLWPPCTPPSPALGPAVDAMDNGKVTKSRESMKCLKDVGVYRNLDVYTPTNECRAVPNRLIIRHTPPPVGITTSQNHTAHIESTATLYDSVTDTTKSATKSITCTSTTQPVESRRPARPRLRIQIPSTPPPDIFSPVSPSSYANVNSQNPSFKRIKGAKVSRLGMRPPGTGEIAHQPHSSFNKGAKDDILSKAREGTQTGEQEGEEGEEGEEVSMTRARPYTPSSSSYGGKKLSFKNIVQRVRSLQRGH